MDQGSDHRKGKRWEDGLPPVGTIHELYLWLAIRNFLENRFYLKFILTYLVLPTLRKYC